MYEYTKVNEKTGEVYKTRALRFVPLTKLETDTPLKEKAVMIPCGKCEGCLIDKSNSWSTRCMLEAKNWPKNCFITLTYNNKNLPKNRTLVKKDLQNFWKRLRKTQEGPIRYLACGEYG